MPSKEIAITDNLILSVTQEAVDELKSLARQHSGVLTAENVVKAARQSSSALHDRFEWDDTEAAEKYRLVQARYLISVSVEILPGERGRRKVFVSLRNERQHGGGYRITTDVMSDKRMREQLLEDALNEMDYFTRKYQTLKELSGVTTVMKKTTQHLRGKTLAKSA